MQNKSLDVYLQLYRAGKMSHPELVTTVATYTYHTILTNRMIQQDEYGGFLLFFYPTIRKTIHRYRAIGKSFEAYLNSYIKYQLKSYFRMLGKQNMQHANIIYQEKVELTYSIAHDSQLSMTQPSAPMDILNEIYQYFQKLNPRRCAGFRKRVFIVIIKFIDRWTPEQIDFVADKFSFDVNQLFTIRLTALERKERRVTRIILLEKQRNTLLQRLHQAQSQNNHTMRTDSQQIEAEKKYQTRLQKINRRIHSIPRSLSNRDIAQILTLSKGTVDSSIYLLKKTIKQYRLRNAEQNDTYLQ